MRSFCTGLQPSARLGEPSISGIKVRTLSLVAASSEPPDERPTFSLLELFDPGEWVSLNALEISHGVPEDRPHDLKLIVQGASLERQGFAFDFGPAKCSATHSVFPGHRLDRCRRYKPLEMAHNLEVSRARGRGMLQSRISRKVLHESSPCRFFLNRTRLRENQCRLDFVPKDSSRVLTNFPRSEGFLSFLGLPRNPPNRVPPFPYLLNLGHFATSWQPRRF
jgi:hypothetical protein